MTELYAATASAGEADADERAGLAAAFEATSRVAGGVVLVTCHRVEIYRFGAPISFDRAVTHRGRQAVEHLLRVATGLESVIVGEDEVLHQVRMALSLARTRPKLDGRLHRLFDTAIAAGRAARARRTESTGNLARSAVEWLRERTPLQGRRVVVAGAGRMGAALAHSAAGAGASVVIASRNPAKAARLAGLYGGQGVDMKQAASRVGDAAGVAVALGGPWRDLSAVDSTLPLPPIADISAPTAIPSSVRTRLNGRFLGIDDLYRSEVPVPGAYVASAERIVATKSAEYLAWLGHSS